MLELTDTKGRLERSIYSEVHMQNSPCLTHSKYSNIVTTSKILVSNCIFMNIKLFTTVIIIVNCILFYLELKEQMLNECSVN